MTTRRSFLAFLAASVPGSTVTLAGCGARNAQAPSPDGPLRAEAAASARTLAALYAAALNGTTTTVDRAEATLYRSHHLGHAQRLTGSSGSVSPSSSASSAATVAAANASPTTATSPTSKDLA